MTITNILSALGNNNSIYPLLVRDCGIENVAKVTMTYKQNAKKSKFIARQATRESAIEEYGTSAVWLGGIPLIDTLCDKFIKSKGYEPKISTQLLKGTTNQNLDLNIKKFAKTAADEVQDLTKVKNNLINFKALQTGKLAASTVIPIAVMGFILPKLNFGFTEKKIKESKKTPTTLLTNFTSMDKFIKNNKPKKEISFTGGVDILNLSSLQKMMILDGGLTIGRVKTARGRKEKTEKLFKMLGMCYLNYRAPKKIDKGLNALTRKIFGINTSLDPKILKDSTFISNIKENAMELPKKLDEKSILEFLDTKQTSTFANIAQQQGLVSYLKNGIRDPRKFVDTNKVKELADSMAQFSKDAKNSGSIESFVKKAYCAKGFNIITNVLLSSFLLAVALPKAQFIFRKLFTGTELDPGINEVMNKND